MKKKRGTDNRTKQKKYHRNQAIQDEQGAYLLRGAAKQPSIHQSVNREGEEKAPSTTGIQNKICSCMPWEHDNSTAIEANKNHYQGL